MTRSAWSSGAAGVCVLAVVAAWASLPAGARMETTAAPSAAPVQVTVDEGTSMSVAVSPDGRTLAIDLQGSIWTLPAEGGAARRVTDLFEDARQPAWSRDGRLIAFQGYRDGGYDIWAIAPDGTNQHKLTWGPYDDREPAWSHDGTRLAFSSDRNDADAYNIWMLDTRSGELRQLTRNPANDFMPAWSPDDSEIAFVSTREETPTVWAVSVSTGAERKLSNTSARPDAVSWSPGGQIVYPAIVQGQGSRLELDGAPLTTDEHVFPFRPSWTSPTEFFYTSNGKIRRRALGGGVRTIEFTATLEVTPVRTTIARDFDSTAPRKVLGVVGPEISPDGTQVVFAALGDLWLMPVGGTPAKLTDDRFLDTDPAWSPDGSQIVYASDKGGAHMDLWIRDLRTGQDRQLTKMASSPMAPAWSADGSRIAFLDVDGTWRRANVSVVEVATGRVTKIHDSLFGPGTPTWSPDGTRVAIAALQRYSPRYREGTNQILTMSSEGAGNRWFTPVPHLSIDSRVGAGPVWSPDGTKMAVIYEGVLAVMPVSPQGEPLGPPRRITTEMAHAPSWTGDSRRILYQSMDRLRMIDVESGEGRDVPLDLTYRLDVPQGRIVVHAGRLIDGLSPTVRTNVDIVIEGNRIRSIQPHGPADRAGATLVDASNLTVMPGLIEWHSHLQNDFGESQGRAWLAFGVTTVRSPGGTPYEAAQDREVMEAGRRPGPRVYSTGYLMEWQRVYYKMGVAVSNPGHLELELRRAATLKHDLVKSYVRMPDLQQRRMVEVAHASGMHVATHEIYPAAFSGVDVTEHTGGTSRRGYSPKNTQGNAYGDVARIFGAAGTIFCPMISGGGLTRLFQDDPAMVDDPRFTLYPPWMRAQVEARRGGGSGGGGGGFFQMVPGGGSSRMVMDLLHAGARIVAGTDSPNAFNLHGELMAYVLAGMSPYEALRAATVTPAEALGLDAGSIAPGKLADLVMVEGNPLENIADTRRVRRVIVNGRIHELADLVNGRAAPSGTEAAR